jgi:hypothetical protein
MHVYTNMHVMNLLEYMITAALPHIAALLDSRTLPHIAAPLDSRILPRALPDSRTLPRTLLHCWTQPCALPHTTARTLREFEV